MAGVIDGPPDDVYDNDRMKIDVDVAYEDDECRKCHGVCGKNKR